MLAPKLCRFATAITSTQLSSFVVPSFHTRFWGFNSTHGAEVCDLKLKYMKKKYKHGTAACQECRPWKEALPDFRLRASAGLSRLFFTVSTFSRLFRLFFFFSPRYTQTVTHTQNLWRTCNGRVRACARSHCVVTFRLARDEGMLLPLTHLMICLLFFYLFFFLCPAQLGNPTQSGGGEQLATAAVGCFVVVVPFCFSGRA